MVGGPADGPNQAWAHWVSRWPCWSPPPRPPSRWIPLGVPHSGGRNAGATPPTAAAMPPTAAATSTAPADGVPHLPSPDNLPPGTTQTAPEGPNMSYLRYLWQAVHTPGVTLGDALMLIAQRPMDAKSAPPSSPTAPVAPSAEQANAPVAPATALPVSP